MLTSPGCDANGYSNTFAAHDFASLKTAGSNRQAATEANSWMTDAEQFLSAYGARIVKSMVSKLQSMLEVRIVMFVHQKKADTRASWSSLLDIAVQVYADVKVYDARLPTWTKIPADAADAKTSVGQGATLRETGSNIINKSILAEKGFNVDKQIVNVHT